jgi:Cu+-exporting ATPase
VVLLSTASGLLLGTEGSFLALQVLALASAFLSPALYRLAAIRTMQTVLDLQARGAVVKSAKVLDAAGRISTAVFCARGTLLLGEPELSYMESFSNLNHEQILAHVVGAEQHGRHPVAVAVSRAARARNIRPDAVRTPLVLPGLGVTAVTSDGQQLVVGSRALMLKERISVARAEQRITAIEASGRTVLLIAIAQRLVGLVALQDGLRPGARAAVQHLLDAGIEPVLLSGDARRTCEALGKTIDIDHLRPEILPGERGSEIERLKSGGATVAVVGRSPADDIALSAASVAIALPSAGSRSTDFDIELASDEVQTAALALGLARHYRSQVLRGAAVIAALAVLSCLLVVGLSAPPAIVPALSLVAVLVAELFVFSARNPEKHAAR